MNNNRSDKKQLGNFMSVIAGKAAKFSRCCEGNIIIMVAVAVPVLLIAAGLAVDLNRYLKTSAYVQAGVDQAALAAVSVDGQDRTEIASRFFYASLTDQVKESLSLDSIKVTQQDPKEGQPLSVTVTVNARMKDYMGAFVGYKEISLSRMGQASRNVDNVEVVLTMASSGTMCSNKFRKPVTDNAIDGDTLLSLDPDPLCKHFNTMKDGVKGFIESLRDNVTVDKLKVGLVPFNHKVRMPDLGSIPPSLTANEMPKYYTDMTDIGLLSPVLPLTSDMNVALRAVDAMQQTQDGMAWSRSDLASHVAGLMLNPDSHKYFAHGDMPEPFGDRTQKVVVLMTDGANAGCCFTNWKLGNFDNQYVYFYEPYNKAQVQICDALKNQGVKIFSILFDVDEKDPGGAQINNVFARCASGAYGETGKVPDQAAQLLCKDKQYCFNVSSDEDLLKTYRQIAQSFYNPTITK